MEQLQQPFELSPWSPTGVCHDSPIPQALGATSRKQKIKASWCVCVCVGGGGGVAGGPNHRLLGHGVYGQDVP